MSSPDWLNYISCLMHNRQYIVAVMQGFEMGSSLLPNLSASSVQGLFDCDLILEQLSYPTSLRSHPAVLHFLARLIAYQPAVIEALLATSRQKIGVVDQLLRLAEDECFEVREAAVGAFVALQRYSSADQIREISPNCSVGLVLQAAPLVDAVKCVDVLDCVAQIVRVWAQSDGDDMQLIFAANGWREVCQTLLESEAAEVAQFAENLTRMIGEE
jgi:hypothetical protein